MPRLIALTEDPGPAFVRELLRIWNNGDAAFPIDLRLPTFGRARICEDLGVGEEVQDGDALVVATSGSTGRPKGVVLTHEALAAQARAVHDRLAVDRTRDRWTACLPLAHMGGLGVVVRALVDDVRLQVLPRFDDATVEGTLISLVPTLADRLDDARSAQFRWIVLGGSGDPKTRPGNVIHTWGMTESGGGIVYGTHPLPGVEVDTVDGELMIRSPSLLRCYRDGTDPKDPDGWYATGDLGSVDDEGAVSVLGRRDQLIITGGENLWPETVETALAGLEGITDVAVCGRDDPEWGQRVVAVIVPTDPASPPSLASVRARAAETLPRFAIPRAMELTDAIPRSALGKIKRSEL